MRRLLCLGSTHSPLNNWIQTAQEFQTVLVFADQEEPLMPLKNLKTPFLETLSLSNKDRGRVLLQLRSFNLRHSFDGILCLEERWLTVAAQLALEWGLPGIEPEDALCELGRPKSNFFIAKDEDALPVLKAAFAACLSEPQYQLTLPESK